jgi:plastocyanin
MGSPVIMASVVPAVSRLRSLLLLAVAGAALVAAGSTHAAAKAKKLYGQTGPGYTITLVVKYGSHTPVRTLKPGTYIFEIQDRATTHSFHLVGPGVNKKTKVGFLGGVPWKVKLKKGTYQYYCDVHRNIMHGSFKVT